MSTAKWTFEPQTGMRPSGHNLAEPNFTRENKRLVRLFAREFLQNVIDARRDDPTRLGRKRPARVELRILDRASKLNPERVAAIFKPLEPHLEAAGHPAAERDWRHPRVLVMEEFGTVGLTGRTSDSFAKGESERWANFWFGEAKRSKGGSSLGRAGQGKITYHIASAARAILALTRREGDRRSYLFGKCIVASTHEIGANHYTHHGYWPKVSGTQPLPETDPGVIAKVIATFQLARKDEPGTSWIIPLIPDNFTGESLVREIVGDFFFSILNGDLTLDACGIKVDADTLQGLITRLGIKDPSPAMFTFLQTCVKSGTTGLPAAKPAWIDGDRTQPESFEEQTLSELRERFRDGKIVSVRLPVTVHPRKGAQKDSFVDVHLQTGDALAAVEELYVRSGLPIAEEQHLATVTHRGFGMVVASDLAIAEFLGYCEVASHMLWNANEKDANERYTDVAETLWQVRKSLPRLYRLLAGTDETIDEDALEDILSIPQAARRKREVVPPPPPAPVPPPPKTPEIFAYSDRPGEWRLEPGPDARKVSYPLTVTFRFAYDRLDGTGNPWTRWHPYDFDLGSAGLEPQSVKNVKVLSRSGQDLRIRLLRPAFGLRIAGFSSDQPLLVQPLPYGKQGL